MFHDISTQADEITQTYKAKFILPPIEGYNILPGMTATVYANQTSSQTDGINQTEIVLPMKTVLEDTAGRYVFVATPENSAANIGVIRRQSVTVSADQLSNDGLIITAGVKPGDLVVIAGMSKMQEGMRVLLTTNEQRNNSF